LLEYAVFLFCLIGCGIHLYLRGRIEGATACLNFLEEQGMVEFEDEDADD
jgi:hypothetical protein